ncbi:odorant receptor 4 [Xylocopa sonorina]|uniref:odorant receptor 4 n=1 Tax=Xylocopa sonorina TaxID=1818115 RepID=UPI00403ADCB7
MSKELRIYRKYSNFVKRFLLISGMNPIRKNRNVIYTYISLWSVLSCFLFLCAIGNFCLQNVGNISLLIASLALFSTVLNVIVKVCCFSIYQKKLRQANNILDSLLEEAVSNTRVRSVAFSNLQAFYRPIYVQSIFMTIVATLYVTKPMIGIIFNHENSTGKVQYPLPYPGAYPWSIDSTLMWQLHYLFHTNVSWFIASTSIGADAFFGYCMFRMSAILRILAFDFEIKLSSDGENKENEEYRRRIFEKCVDRHVLLLQCRDIVQEAYGAPILLVMVTNAIGMCTLVFQTVQGSGMGIEKAVTICYFIMKLIQTFLYTWPGDVVLSESELFRRNVYFSGWYEEKNTSFAKQFLLNLAQRPIIFKACDIMQVSLDLFVKILNTAISYYFLLETLTSGK